MSKQNLTQHHPIVDRKMRNQLNNHKSAVIWFTGLSGSGKSTLAHAVEEKLYQKGCRTFVLDGDNIRSALSSDLGFSDDDRKENTRRVGEVAKLMAESGVIALVALISPFKADRNAVRNMLDNGEFIEVYCKTSLQICEQRDTKGLYKKARIGAINNYTGIDSVYQAPTNPELVVDSEVQTLDESTDKVMWLLQGILVKNNVK